MFWGAKHTDYGHVENKPALATVCWLGQLLLGYEAPVTRFTQILNSKGENLTLFPIKQTGETTTYNLGINFKAIVLSGKAEEILLEPVVEVREDLHRELRKLAVLNDLKIYVLANAILEEFLSDEVRVKQLLKKLKI
jgi:hypothetical protein